MSDIATPSAGYPDLAEHFFPRFQKGNLRCRSQLCTPDCPKEAGGASTDKNDAFFHEREDREGGEEAGGEIYFLFWAPIEATVYAKYTFGYPHQPR